MKLFKHKATTKVKKHKDVKEYLFTNSVQCSGAIGFDKKERKIMPQNEKCYVMFRVEFVNANGIDIETDIENRNKVNELVKALIHPFKIVDMNIVKNGLDNNIKQYEDLLHEKNVTNLRKELIIERLNVMKFYNDEKYVTTFFYITLEDLEIFNKLAPMVFHIKRLNEDEIQKVLSCLNNDME